MSEVQRQAKKNKPHIIQLQDSNTILFYALFALKTAAFALSFTEIISVKAFLLGTVTRDTMTVKHFYETLTFTYHNQGYMTFYYIMVALMLVPVVFSLLRAFFTNVLPKTLSKISLSVNIIFGFLAFAFLGFSFVAIQNLLAPYSSTDAGYSLFGHLFMMVELAVIVFSAYGLVLEITGRQSKVPSSKAGQAVKRLFSSRRAMQARSFIKKTVSRILSYDDGMLMIGILAALVLGFALSFASVVKASTFGYSENGSLRYFLEMCGKDTGMFYLMIFILLVPFLLFGIKYMIPELDGRPVLIAGIACPILALMLAQGMLDSCSQGALGLGFFGYSLVGWLFFLCEVAAAAAAGYLMYREVSSRKLSA